MLKINLITDEIKPFIKEKGTPIKFNLKKMLLVASIILVILGASAYFAGTVLLKNMQKSNDDIFVQDTKNTLPKPDGYKKTIIKKKKELENIKSDKTKMVNRKKSEDKSLAPLKKSIKKENIKKEIKVIDKKLNPRKITRNKSVTKKNSKKRNLKRVVAKRTTSKTIKLSSKRIENFIINEHSTPLALISAIAGITGIETMRLNNPQTIYLEVTDGSVGTVRSQLKSRGLKVRMINIGEKTNIEATLPKTTGKPSLKSVTSIPEIENRVSSILRNYGGYAVLKDNSKPIGKFFSYTVKYIIPSISFKNSLQLLKSLNTEYDGLGISEIVYNNKTKKLNLDISIYTK